MRLLPFYITLQYYLHIDTHVQVPCQCSAVGRAPDLFENISNHHVYHNIRSIA